MGRSRCWSRDRRRVQITVSSLRTSFLSKHEAEYLSGDARGPRSCDRGAMCASVGDEFARYCQSEKERFPTRRCAMLLAKPPSPPSWQTSLQVIWASRWSNKQDLLETLSCFSERLEKVYGLMQGEMSVLEG